MQSTLLDIQLMILRVRVSEFTLKRVFLSNQHSEFGVYLVKWALFVAVMISFVIVTHFHGVLTDYVNRLRISSSFFQILAS